MAFSYYNVKHIIMKISIVRFVHLALLVTCVSSCYEKIELTNDNESPITNKNYTVSMNSVLAHLRLHPSPTTKASETSIEPFIWQNDTVMYLVNDVKGWQLISADKRACPIIAYAEKEHLSLSDISDSTLFGTWVFSVAEDIYILKHGDFPIENENTEYWRIIEGLPNKPQTKSGELDGWRLFRSVLVSSVNDDTGPVIPTKWGGFDPWNICFPYNLNNERMGVGSPNVAIAQILYWSHQNQGVPTYSYTNVTSQQGLVYDELDETLIVSSYPIFSFNDSSTTAWNQMKQTVSGTGNENYVSYLMAKVRYLTDRYQEEHFNPSLDVSALNYFGLNANYGNFSMDTITHYLHQGKPVIVLTQVLDPTFLYNTRACIVDAYYIHTRTYDVYYIYDPNNTYDFGTIIEEEDEGDPVVIPPGYDWFCQRNTTTLRFIAMNWGCNGQGDSTSYAVNSTLWDWVHYSGPVTVQPNKMIYNIRVNN